MNLNFSALRASPVLIKQGEDVSQEQIAAGKRDRFWEQFLKERGNGLRGEIFTELVEGLLEGTRYSHYGKRKEEGQSNGKNSKYEEKIFIFKISKLM